MTDDAGSDTDATASSRRTFLAGVAGVGATAVGASAVFSATSDASTDAATFTVRIENVADPEMVGYPPLISPGAYAVHAPGELLFTPGEPERDDGLEEIAEDGMPGRLAETLASDGEVVFSGTFDTPEGGDEPGPLPPGGAYEFEVEGRPDVRLSFATMYVQSNDLFYAPEPDGMALFEHDGDAVTGDVTDRVTLWDAGTEINEQPGAGENQAPRQPGTGVGLVERGTVAPIADVNGYDYPAVSDVLEVTLSTGSDDAGASR